MSIIDASQSWVYMLSLWKRVIKPRVLDMEGEIIGSARFFFFLSCDWQHISILQWVMRVKVWWNWLSYQFKVGKEDIGKQN